MKFSINDKERVNTRIMKIPKGWIDDYSIEIDDFNLPPLLEIVRYLTEWTDNDFRLSAKSKDEIVRIGILNKPVTVLYKGEKVETFTLNQRDGLFDSFDVLRKNPVVMIVLQQIAVARLLEKSLPLPTESAPPTAARVRPVSPALSSGKQGAE
jgi:hypothetical protein